MSDFQVDPEDILAEALRDSLNRSQIDETFKGLVATARTMMVPRLTDTLYQHQCRWFSAVHLTDTVEGEFRERRAMFNAELKFATTARRKEIKARLAEMDAIMSDWGHVCQDIWINQVWNPLNQIVKSKGLRGYRRERFFELLSDHRACEMIGSKTLSQMIKGCKGIRRRK